MNSDYNNQPSTPPSDIPPQAPPPAYPAGPAGAPPPPVYGQQVYTPPPVYTTRPLKDKGMALVLEILPGLFGFLGIGWIYAGNATPGILLLVGFLCWNVIAGILDGVTVGIFLCLHVPINIAALVLSPVMLNNYTKKHPELFG
ncbi:MAG TPA: hypothetical protein VIO61_15550 [Anaerolineaceae bacterium]